MQNLFNIKCLNEKKHSKKYMANIMPILYSVVIKEHIILGIYIQISLYMISEDGIAIVMLTCPEFELKRQRCYKQLYGLSLTILP